jgi:large subunit ribosomal protein L4e
MKLPKLDANNSKKEQVELPVQFNEVIRVDLIRRAVTAIQHNRRQSYGAKPEAGKRSSAKLSRRRRKYKGSYGHGISRVPRKILSRRGTRFYWVGAFAPGMVGGRRAHPPKASKIWEDKINKKENRKAIRSAMAATINREIVSHRGHKIPENYPFIIDNTIEKLEKTKDVTSLLKKLGFSAELTRSEIKNIRAGKGKSRSRPYKKRKGILLVTGDKCPLLHAARNIPGCEITTVKELNAEILAPGALPGRATLWSENAIKQLAEEKYFT